MPSKPEGRFPMKGAPGLVFCIVLGTAILGTILLTPCLLELPEWHATKVMESQAYAQICTAWVQFRTHVAGQAQHLVDGQVQHLVEIPGTVLDAWRQMSILERAQLAVQRSCGPLFARVSSFVESAWTRVFLTLPLQSPTYETAAPISCVKLADFMAVVDPTYVSRGYLKELWGNGGWGFVNPDKASVWLLTCRVGDECTAAAGALQAAAQSVLVLDGSNFRHDSTLSTLQGKLLTFIWSHPDGLVLVTQPEQLHPSCLFTLANSAEVISVQPDGQPVSNKRPFFVVLAQYSADGQHIDIADAIMKSWLESAPASGVVYATTPIRRFFRQINAVLPVRTLPSVLSDGGDFKGDDSSANAWLAWLAAKAQPALKHLGELVDTLTQKPKSIAK